ncbi:MAG: hypothetical protein QM504_18430 [Pseudomonadota bacterium]
MIEPHQNWFIAVKQVEEISEKFKAELVSMGADVLHDKMYIHVHFFIPEDVYPHADETLKEQGFTLSDSHPPICSIGKRENYEVFEKRIPIIEVREHDALKHLFDKGVCMSGGAGRPHIHVKIPAEKRQLIIELLAEHQYFPKPDLGKETHCSH